MSFRNWIFRMLAAFPLALPQSVRQVILKSGFASLARRLYLKISVDNTTQVVSLRPPLDGYRMRINLLMQKALIYGTFEPAVCDLILRRLRPGWTCLDVGANIGYLTLLMARQVAARGYVVAFEPLPSNYRVLRENVTANHHDANVRSECLALSDRSGVHEFLFRSEVYTAGGTLVSPAPSGVNPEIARLQVYTRRGDDYLADQTISSSIDFIKIDVEGAEGLVLEGLRSTLRRHHPLVLMEVHTCEGSTADQALKILNEQGYSLTNIDDGHILAEFICEARET